MKPMNSYRVGECECIVFITVTRSKRGHANITTKYSNVTRDAMGLAKTLIPRHDLIKDTKSLRGTT